MVKAKDAKHLERLLEDVIRSQNLNFIRQTVYLATPDSFMLNRKSEPFLHSVSSTLELEIRNWNEWV